jgi:hypothetical protein
MALTFFYFAVHEIIQIIFLTAPMKTLPNEFQKPLAPVLTQVSESCWKLVEESAKNCHSQQLWNLFT